MPSIEITADQAAALARGEDVTITTAPLEPPEPPKSEVRWNCQFIPSGKIKQRYHSEKVPAPHDEPQTAAQNWLDRPLGRKLLTESIRQAGGGVIVVCPRQPEGPAQSTEMLAYSMQTRYTRFFTVTSDLKISEGVVPLATVVPERDDTLFSEEHVRRVLAAVVMAHPCTFPKGFSAKFHRMNAITTPDDIHPSVVTSVIKALKRTPISATPRRLDDGTWL